MPAYYTSWGRYTQLAGLLILPTAYYLFNYISETGNSQTEEKLTGSKLIIRFILVRNLNGRPSSRPLSCCSLPGYADCCLLHSLPRQILEIKNDQNTANQADNNNFHNQHHNNHPHNPMVACNPSFFNWTCISRYLLPLNLFADFSWNFLTSGMGEYTLGLAGLGILWAIFQKQAFAWTLLLWTGLLFLLANLGAFSLPGAGVINNTSVTISLFLPISVFGGYLVSWVIEGWQHFIPSRWKPGYYALWIIIAFAIGLLGAQALLPIIESDNHTLTTG